LIYGWFTIIYSMLTQEKINEIAQKKGKINTKEIAEEFKVSRQYTSGMISSLVKAGKLIKIGSTRKAFYIFPEYASRHKEIFPTKLVKALKNENLEEHKVLKEIEDNLPFLFKLSENVRDIFTYAFLEMLNNAIEHSQSKNIIIEVKTENKTLSFCVNDFGIGVFRSVMEKKGLQSELEAVEDLLKGKTTTAPKLHSGEGIFFTSKVGDIFILDSFGNQLTIDNKIKDVFLKKQKSKKGTKVVFKMAINSPIHLGNIFKKYSDVETGDYGFDKTEIKIKLYTIGGIYISRSQARRVLVGLEKFKFITLDFDKVPMVGQGFADEIFRVFHLKYPKIKIQEINTNSAVQFMIERAKKEAGENLQVE